MTGFTVSGDQIIAPNGQPFVARGIDIDSDFLAQTVSNSAAQPLTTDFPDVNFIRVVVGFNATGTLPSLSSIEQAINEATAKGIVVELQYGPYGTTITGSTLQTVADWFGQAAAAFKGNPYVWFASQNEPGPNNVSDEMSAIYNAVRGAGDTAPILLTPHGGGVDTSGMTQSVIKGMNNVVWDLHYYNWVSDYSTSLSANQTALANEIATFRAFDNLPVIVSEYGNSTDGTNIDPGWQATVEAVNTATGISGTGAWGWNPGGSGDQLFNNNNPSNGLNAYGQMVANYIAAGSSGSSGGSGNGGSTVGSTVSPNETVITPGSGSITDTSGNVYTLTSGDVAEEKGSPITGGGGTSKMEFYNGNIYGQDATSGTWYQWSGSSQIWTETSAPPAPGGSGAGSGGPSPAGAVIFPGQGSITDSSGHVFTITSAGVLDENGTVASGTFTTSAAAWENNTLYAQKAATKTWYTFNGHGVTLASGPPTSPNGQSLSLTSGGGLIDTKGNIYQLTSGGVAEENGSAMAGGSGTAKMEFYNGNIYGQDATSGTWYQWSGSSQTWTETSAPPDPPPIQMLMQSAAALPDMRPSMPAATTQVPASGSSGSGAPGTGDTMCDVIASQHHGISLSHH